MDNAGDNSAILIIDWDRELADKISGTLKDKGLRVCYATSEEQGKVLLESSRFEAVLVRDELNGGIDGESIAAFKLAKGTPEVIVYTSEGDPEQAKTAIKYGVWEYLASSFLEKELPDIVRRAMHYRNNKSSEAASKRRTLRYALEKTGIIGRSDIMQACIDQIIAIGQSESNVLIYGESGTGKELFASTIHDLSSRADRPLTVVDCAALPPSLVESILFGHLKGSFTGADKAQRGLIEQADGGTLFLDEIGEIPPAVQKKLLRVIQEHTYLPVGSTTERRSDFRLIAATNRDLHEMVDAGAFREDLLFRLKTFYLELPPLRERKSDINELAYYYRDLFCKQQKLKRKKFSSEFLLFMKQYEWPGNVRELFQTIERSISEALESNILYPIHLPPEIRIQVIQNELADGEEGAGDARNTDALDSALENNLPTLKAAREAAIEDCEEEYLSRLLHRTGGDIKKCCSIAGLSRSRLYDLLKKYDLIQRKLTVSKDS